ncbi:VOC family protein [Aeromonas cavernicola]|uniref:VOC domain-containing protein n=1 Tax=Aeromonas cavernicola TaxID=1006623 RepID=A0A2H9U138_9GAMM|nr:VOC family protein [Aeromonas cavernicola]PJG57777.1 hypothetical protein CUC53_16195 [Aeromonas cavernicola]
MVRLARSSAAITLLILFGCADAATDSSLAQQQALHAQSKGSPWLSSRLLTPHLTVQNPEQSKRFYQQAFGFELRDQVIKQGLPVHVEMSYLGELVLMFVPAEQATADRGNATIPPADLSQGKRYFYLYVKDLDSTVANAQQAGATLLQAPHQAAWGDRFALIADLDGYQWGLAQAASFPGELAATPAPK